jgi:uncharacterized protein (TIGR03083 family)
MSERLDALSTSAARLRAIGEGLDDGSRATSAYPSEWTVADVFSHLGSAGTILSHLFDDGLVGADAPADRNSAIWSEWNAMPPSAQVARSLEVDAGLLERFVSLDDDRRANYHLSLGPLELDFEGLVGIRLNEHAVHTWDIEVALDPSATIPAAIVAPVVDNLGMVTRFSAKPDGEPRSVHVRTSNPTRDLVIEVGPAACSLAPGGAEASDLELPAEAFVRLVYGRLDADHTPPGVAGEVLDGLRRVFRGV